VINRHHCDAGRGLVRAPKLRRVRSDVGDPVRTMRRNTTVFAAMRRVVT
jgi:hypothetical protein